MSIIHAELNESKEPTTINNKEHNIINKIIAIMITNVLIPELLSMLQNIKVKNLRIIKYNTLVRFLLTA